MLSGGSKLDLQWKPYKSGIFQSKTPGRLEIDQLFINGKNQRMARYPNYTQPKKRMEALRFQLLEKGQSQQKQI